MTTKSPRVREAALRADISRLEVEMREIHDNANDKPLSAGQQVRWDDLTRAVEKKREQLEQVRDEMRADVLGQFAGGAGDKGDQTLRDKSFGFEPDRSTDEGRQLPELDQARRTVERAFDAGQLPDYAAERATSLFEHGHQNERSLAARWATAAGAPEYRTAFAKMLADPAKGHLLWNQREQAAYRAVAEVQAEMESRTAMSTTGANGGYMIPLTLDPAIMLTNDGSNNPLRQLATVKQTMTNAWQGVTSAGATAEWKTEGSEAADGSPTVGNPSIPVFFGDSFVPYSFEVGQDAVNFLDELSEVLVDAADNLMATAYTTGDGSSAPQGIVTGLVGGSSEINTTGSETYDDSDPYALQNALPARFSANAVFMSHIATANAYRQMETSNGALMFPELRENPPSLIGKRWHENSNMDGSINAAATANNYVMVYGDVAKGFYIVDRVGSTLELIPNLIGSNNRPTGQRGAMLWFRTGSKVVVPQALRLLDIPTTA